MHSPSVSINEAEAEPEDWSAISIGIKVGSRTTVNPRESHNCAIGGTSRSTGTFIGGVLGMEVKVTFREANVAMGVGVDRSIDVVRFQWGIGRKL